LAKIKITLKRLSVKQSPWLQAVLWQST